MRAQGWENWELDNKGERALALDFRRGPKKEIWPGA